ncbi:MAG: hypothetical protein M3R31_02640 [Pseudomonadota bacterium]|nr:hypothetical protein [Pseudomonadota bacterium]
MEFDESNSGFPVALRAPGRLNVTESVVYCRLASASDGVAGARMHAPGLARTSVDSAVLVFGQHCTQMLDTRSAAAPSSSSTVH